MAMAYGKPGSLMALPGMPVLAEMGVTMFGTGFPTSATSTVRPSGVTAKATGSQPTLIGLPVRLVLVEMATTVPRPEVSQATYTVLPCGAIASATGSGATRIARPVVPAGTLIGDTVPEPPFATYTVLLSGVATMASGCPMHAPDDSATPSRSYAGYETSDQAMGTPGVHASFVGDDLARLCCLCV